MKEHEAIEYLESLEKGQYMTVNIPLMGDDVIPVTVMYMGKDSNNRYNFLDTGRFILTKEFIEKGKVTIYKEFDGDKALEIYSKVRLEMEKRNKKNRDAR